MKLWILLPVEGDEHWEPWYDKCFGMVIRAETETEARAIANEDSGAENGSYFETTSLDVWLKSEHTTCELLTSDSGDPGVILSDVHWA